MLYPDAPRSPKPRHRQSGESLFAFFNRLEEPRVAALRTTANRWLTQIPASALPEFLARLEAKDNDHVSALFELFLYQALNRATLSAQFCEAPAKGSRPDLLLSAGGGVRHVVEARVRMPSQEEIDDDLRLHQLLRESARHMRDHALRVWIRKATISKQTPSARNFAKWVDTHAGSAILADEIANQEHRLRYSDPASGWDLHLSIVRLSNAEDVPESVIAGGMTEAYWCRALPLLENALNEKRRQHRSHSLPMVYALGWNDFKNEPGHDDVARALRRHWDSHSDSESAHAPLIWCGQTYPTAIDHWSCTLFVDSEADNPLEQYWPYAIARVDREGCICARRGAVADDAEVGG